MLLMHITIRILLTLFSSSQHSSEANMLSVCKPFVQDRPFYRYHEVSIRIQPLVEEINSASGRIIANVDDDHIKYLIDNMPRTSQIMELDSILSHAYSIETTNMESENNRSQPDSRQQINDNIVRFSNHLSNLTRTQTDLRQVQYLHD